MRSGSDPVSQDAVWDLDELRPGAAADPEVAILARRKALIEPNLTREIRANDRAARNECRALEALSGGGSNRARAIARSMFADARTSGIDVRAVTVHDVGITCLPRLQLFKRVPFQDIISIQE
jgi:hypothetical protein